MYNPYSWLKAFHLIVVIGWMAGIFYLPRLFVYHCGAVAGSEQSETFKIMERRLLNLIMNPAMALTWLLGLWLAVWAGWFFYAWLWLKLLLVLALSALHVFCMRWMRDFQRDQNRHSSKFYRVVNEIPTVLMALIVILAVVKPF